MGAGYYIVIGAVILGYGYATVENIIAWRRVRRLRKEWRAQVRAKYQEWGEEPPAWTKD